MNLKDNNKINVMPIPFYFDHEKNSSARYCDFCFKNQMCFQYHLNIENEQIKNILFEEKKEQEGIDEVINMILQENDYDFLEEENNSNNANSENNQINQSDINNNYLMEKFENIFPENISNKIKSYFTKPKNLIDQDYIDYFIKQIKLIKNEECLRFFNEDSLKLNHTCLIDFREFQIIKFSEYKHCFYFFIAVPKDEINFLMKEKSLKLIDVNLKNFISTEKKQDGEVNADLAKRFVICDSINDENYFYNGVLENKIIYESKNKRYILEISILKHYIINDRFSEMNRNENNDKINLNEIKPLFRFKIKPLLFSYIFMNFFRGNIYVLTFHENFENLRKKIIKFEKPNFDKTEQVNKKLKKIKEDDYSTAKELESLNEGQHKALMKIISAKDYCTIEGYPGTGKTSLIVLVIQILRKLNKKILISAFTNSAIDNILLRLKEKNIDFYRIGSETKMNEELKELNDNSMNEKKFIINENSFDTIDKWKQFINNVNIIGCTTIGANMALLNKIEFDYCFIDEAGQLNEYSIIGPILLAKTFVLIGDSFQVIFIENYSNIFYKIKIF